VQTRRISSSSETETSMEWNGTLINFLHKLTIHLNSGFDYDFTQTKEISI